MSITGAHCPAGVVVTNRSNEDSDDMGIVAKYCSLEGYGRAGNPGKKFFKIPVAPEFAFAILSAPFAPIGHGQHNLRNR